MGVFESKILSNDVINNDSIGDDEVVASDVSPRYFSLFSSLFRCAVASLREVRRSVRRYVPCYFRR